MVDGMGEKVFCDAGGHGVVETGELGEKGCGSLGGG